MNLAAWDNEVKTFFEHSCLSNTKRATDTSNCAHTFVETLQGRDLYQAESRSLQPGPC